MTGVSLDKTGMTLDVGGTETLTATVTPSDATNKAVTWASTDEAVAAVDGNGTVTAITAGTAAITVTTADGDKTAECAVTVAVTNFIPGDVNGDGKVNRADLLRLAKHFSGYEVQLGN